MHAAQLRLVLALCLLLARAGMGQAFTFADPAWVGSLYAAPAAPPPNVPANWETGLGANLDSQVNVTIQPYTPYQSVTVAGIAFYNGTGTASATATDGGVSMTLGVMTNQFDASGYNGMFYHTNSGIGQHTVIITPFANAANDNAFAGFVSNGVALYTATNFNALSVVGSVSQTVNCPVGYLIVCMVDINNTGTKTPGGGFTLNLTQNGSGASIAVSSFVATSTSTAVSWTFGTPGICSGSILVFQNGPGIPAVFYADAQNGSDKNYGGVNSKWQHLAYACTNLPTVTNPAPVLIVSGTFGEDNIMLNRPATVMAVGSPAIITNLVSTHTPIFLITNAPNVVLSNLYVSGSQTVLTNNGDAIQFAQGFVGVNPAYCTNDQVLTCQTTNCWIGVDCYVYAPAINNQFDGFRLMNTSISNWAFGGFYEQSAGENVGSIFCSNAITDFNNVGHGSGIDGQNSGSGMVMFNVDTWQAWSNHISDCNYAATNTSTGGGGSGGIFPVFSSRNVSLCFNEVDHIEPPPNGDGVAIDLDRGTTKSLVMGNYTHDNGGAGLYPFQGLGTNIWIGNFSYNDGIRNGAGLWVNEQFGSVFPPSTSYDLFINNTIIGRAQSLLISAGAGTNGYFNNIFGQITNTLVLISAANVTATTNANFGGNDYIGTNTSFTINWNGSTLTTLPSFRSQNQENGGTGSTNDPLFVNAALGTPVGYSLTGGSPCISGGIDAHASYSWVTAAFTNFLGTVYANGNKRQGAF